jgi:hypothetical protein
MKVELLMDGDRPKVKSEELKRVVEGAGLEVVSRKGDVGIVLGGDGIFSRYGRSESIPLLFVGVKSRSATGSKAYLAATYFDELGDSLARLKSGEYTVQKHRRLSVAKGTRSLGEVFTDVYLQRGADSNCIRYTVEVTGPDTRIAESAIGDGVVVTTSAGSTGYYSYPDRIKGDFLDAEGHSGIGGDRIGICHVVPTYTERQGTGEHPLRYTVQWGCTVELTMTRPADARLYGASPGRGGARVKAGETIRISPSQLATKVVSFD